MAHQRGCATKFHDLAIYTSASPFLSPKFPTFLTPARRFHCRLRCAPVSEPGGAHPCQEPPRASPRGCSLAIAVDVRRAPVPAVRVPSPASSHTPRATVSPLQRYDLCPSPPASMRRCPSLPLRAALPPTPSPSTAPSPICSHTHARTQPVGRNASPASGLVPCLAHVTLTI